MRLIRHQCIAAEHHVAVVSIDMERAGAPARGELAQRVLADLHLPAPLPTDPAGRYA